MDFPFALRAGFIFCVFLIAGCEKGASDQTYQHHEFIQVTKDLSTDAMAGRAPGTDGNAAARHYLLNKIAAIGLRPFTVTPEGGIQSQASGEAKLHVFSRSRTTESGEVTQLADGVNILFAVPGTRDAARTIVISAHYDHLGVVDGKIYNGADDNASGVAGVLAIAQHFQDFLPENNIIFALFDAEENGHDGAREFVKDYAELLAVDLNVNLDMISRSDVNELYVAGTYHQPHWVPFVEELSRNVPVTLLMGYDDPALGADKDWTHQSDHFQFHQQGIPFLYFGVEDHPDYHAPTDTFDRIPQAFFSDSIQTVITAAESIDAELESLLEPTQ